MTRLWDKGAALDDRVLAYTAGEDHLLDNRLVRYDILASIAHAEMLGEQGLLSAGDLAAITAALRAIGEEHERGQWRITLEQEDCQTAIENLLTARIGAAGGRLHAGRSRNDQVLAALRLYLRDATQSLHDGALERRGGARRAGGARRLDRASRVHPYAAGHAEHGGAVGARLRRRDPRRCGGSATREAARGQESARVRRGLRHTESRRQPRIDAAASGLHRHARAGDRRAAVARQGRSAPVVRDHLAHPGPGSSRRRPAAVLHAGIRLREPAGRLYHGILDHAAEAQSGRVRADARPQRGGASGAQRGARHHAKTEFRLPPRLAAHQGAPVSRHRFLPADARHPAERARGFVVQAGEHSLGSRHSRGSGGECPGGARRTSRSARPINGSRRSSRNSK